MSGTIEGTWTCKDCGIGFDYTATIIETLSVPSAGIKRIRARVDNDSDLREHAESHGHEGGTQPLMVIVDVAL